MFLSICKEITPNIISCDNFILSFFHELGHYATDGLFSDREESEYFNLINNLQKKDILVDNDYIKYYKNPLEYEATVWGCDYILDNQQQVEIFFRTIQNMLYDVLKNS